MKEFNEKIKEFLEKGLSLRKVAKELNLSYSTCRSRAVREGFIKPKLKKVKDGKTICCQCKLEKEISYFPNLFEYGTYTCVDCLEKNNHKYQISKVGCTPERYQELYLSQSGKCAICESDFGHITQFGCKAKLAVDHNHKTNEIRGLLCNRCNRGLGYLGENNLHKALVYCKKC